jgi:hypothetical protein
MSGSSSFSAGGDFGGDEGISCYRIVERVQLSSPVPDLVGALEEGDVLQVSLQTQNGIKLLRILDEEQETLGSIVPMRMRRIIQCIEEGVTYIASVLEIDEGSIMLEVRASR